MTVPLVVCKSKITGNVITIPDSEPSLSAHLPIMEDLIQTAKVGRHRIKGINYDIIETNEYLYCTLSVEKNTDKEGKTRIFEYDRASVIRFCDSIEKFAEENTKEYISYAHDIQYLIGMLIHKSVVNNRNINNTEQLISNLNEINTLTSIMSAKDAFFRFNTGAFAESIYNVDVTGKFFKIYKAMEKMDQGSKSSKRIEFKFKSQKNCIVRTLEVFDFIPYMVLENAYKYSPHDCEISVDIREMGNHILVEVESLGPMLVEFESTKIFEKSYRGENAKKTGVPGKGMGLFHLNQAMIKLNMGTISVSQPNRNTDIKLSGVDYTETRFVLRLFK